jgi:hypothetical protein
MARTKADPTILRPKCPEHPDNRVWLDGFEACRWSEARTCRSARRGTATRGAACVVAGIVSIRTESQRATGQTKGPTDPS